MTRRLAGAFLVPACLLMLASAAPAFALVIAQPSGPNKLIAADVIVNGQVVAIEDRDVEAKPFPTSPNKVMYRIAVLQIADNLKGKVKGNQIRVGFQVPKQGQPQPNPAPIKIRPPIGGGGFNMQLTVGQGGLFFLKKHAEGDFYVLPTYGTFVSNQNKQAFDKELQDTRDTLKVLENPMASLKSNDSNTRLEAAAVLIALYRSPTGPNKLVPIDAEESKLILKALKEADWDRTKYAGVKYQMNPAMLFSRLNLTPQDGFKNPGKGIFTPDFAKSAKDWLESNWQTYRIKKYESTGDQAGGPVQIQPVPGGPIQIQPVPGNPIKIKPIKIKPIRIKPGQANPIQILPVQPNNTGQVQPVSPALEQPTQALPVPAKE